MLGIEPGGLRLAHEGRRSPRRAARRGRRRHVTRLRHRRRDHARRRAVHRRRSLPRHHLLLRPADRVPAARRRAGPLPRWPAPRHRGGGARRRQRVTERHRGLRPGRGADRPEPTAGGRQPDHPDHQHAAVDHGGRRGGLDAVPVRHRAHDRARDVQSHGREHFHVVRRAGGAGTPPRPRGMRRRCPDRRWRSRQSSRSPSRSLRRRTSPRLSPRSWSDWSPASSVYVAPLASTLPWRSEARSAHADAHGPDARIRAGRLRRAPDRRARPASR